MFFTLLRLLFFLFCLYYSFSTRLFSLKTDSFVSQHLAQCRKPKSCKKLRHFDSLIHRVFMWNDIFFPLISISRLLHRTAKHQYHAHRPSCAFHLCSRSAWEQGSGLLCLLSRGSVASLSCEARRRAEFLGMMDASHPVFVIQPPVVYSVLNICAPIHYSFNVPPHLQIGTMCACMCVPIGFKF